MPTPLPNDFASLCGQLQGFSGHVNGLLQNVDGETREVVSSLLKVWEKNFGELQTALPAAINDIESKIAEVKSQNDGMKSTIAATKAEIEKTRQAQAAAAAAKKSAPKIPPLKPIDPELGVSLRDELLARFGVSPEANQEALPEEVHEIWEGWKFEPWDNN